MGGCIWGPLYRGRGEVAGRGEVGGKGRGGLFFIGRQTRKTVAGVDGRGCCEDGVSLQVCLRREFCLDRWLL